MQPFLDTLAVNYGAGLHVLDFLGDPDGSRTVINDWVEDRTNDRIEDLLPQGSITVDTRLVLTNAIYFSAAWDDPFEPGDTRPAPFTLADGSTVDVPTLHQTSQSYRYGEGDGFRAAELPYDGEQLSMVVVVPDDLASFEASMTGATLAQITDSLEGAEVELALPKFDFDAPLGLKEHLMALGMKDAFLAADFSGIDGTRNLVITDVLHKGFVAIDEKGTEAAAATAVIIGETSVPEHRQLTVDRPFVFLIRDIPTGAILFVGRVVDPR
jgi:serpin B